MNTKYSNITTASTIRKTISVGTATTAVIMIMMIIASKS